MSVPNTYCGEDYSVILGDRANSTLGIPCFYFSDGTTSGATPPASFPWGAQDPFHLLAIAALFNTAAIANCYFVISSFKKVHRLTNMAVTPVVIEATKWRCRRDLPNVAPWSGSIQTALGRFFADAGIDTANKDGNNQCLKEIEMSPFNLPTWCSLFSCVRKKNIRLQAGKSAVFSVNQRRPFTVRPDQFANIAAGSSWSAATSLLQWRQGETFWLFKAHNEADCTDSTSVNVMTGPQAKIALFTKWSYDYKWTNDQTVVITKAAVTGAVGAPTGGVDTGAKFVSSITGTVTTGAHT